MEDTEAAGGVQARTINHWQVMKYLGDRTVGIAKNSFTRVAHSRYGFGELRLKPLGDRCQE